MPPAGLAHGCGFDVELRTPMSSYQDAVVVPGAKRRAFSLVSVASGICAALLSVTLLSACSLFDSARTPSTPAPVVESHGQQVPPATKPAPKPAKPAVAAAPAPPKTVAIVYADPVPMYGRIAAGVAARLPKRSQIFALKQEQLEPRKTELKQYDQVVAIGATAARSASTLPAKPLVYYQVFNRGDYGLERSHMRAISMTPPMEQQFGALKSLAPDVNRLGVITGPGHEALIRQAGTAARQHGMQLVHRVTHTDKETLFEFKRLVPEIDAFWLLPDNRVLSHRVLRELMAYGTQHKKRILAFSPELLQLGALMSASSVESDVVDQIVAALESFDATGPGNFQVRPLTKTSIQINKTLAQRLGYSRALSPGGAADVQ